MIKLIRKKGRIIKIKIAIKKMIRMIKTITKEDFKNLLDEFFLKFEDFNLEPEQTWKDIEDINDNNFIEYSDSSDSESEKNDLEEEKKEKKLYYFNKQELMDIKKILISL